MDDTATIIMDNLYFKFAPQNKSRGANTARKSGLYITVPVAK